MTYVLLSPESFGFFIGVLISMFSIALHNHFRACSYRRKYLASENARLFQEEEARVRAEQRKWEGKLK